MSPIATITIQTQQRGVVLVVSLLILLVLTLLGISSLDGSIMEEKMASNTQTANFTFQKAESAIRQTYYQENQDPIGAFTHAELGHTETYDVSEHNLNASAVMSVPTTTVKLPLYNNSAGLFEARRVEITGTAEVDGIKNTNIQGYSIYPMLAVDETD